MGIVSERYGALEFEEWADLKRWLGHWTRRAIVALVPRRLRRMLNPKRWPPHWRARFDMATEEELADLARAATIAQERKRQMRELLKRKKEYKRLIINSLAKCGAVYKWSEDGQRYLRKIKFERIRISVEGSAIYFKVNTKRLPDRVLIPFLRDDAVLETLCASCERQVEFTWDMNKPEVGFWYTVQLKAGVHGIPSEVDFSKMLELLEARKKSTHLTIPIGAGVNGEALFGEIDDFPHLLVAGATGAGKSVWVKQALVTLALRNSVKQLRMVMVDLKGGVELSQFRKLPHVLQFVKEKEGVVATLRMVLQEVKHRLRTFEDIGVVDIKGYNQRRFSGGRPLPSLPHWLVVIDELASLMLDKSVRPDAEPLLADITALARAAGVHVIAATQRPSVDVIIGLIKANITVRIAFSTATQQDSRVIIDVGDACGLNPKGRMIFMRGDQKIQLQGPLITQSMVTDKVTGITAGETQSTLERSKRHNFTPEDYFMRALVHYKGQVAIEVLYSDFRSLGVGRTEIERCIKEAEGKEIELDGHLYRLENPNRPGQKSVPRRLIEIIPQAPLEPSPLAGPEPMGGAASAPTISTEMPEPQLAAPEAEQPTAPSPNDEDFIDETIDTPIDDDPERDPDA